MADLLITLAELLLISSYLFSNILFLRILAALGMFAYVIAGFAAGYQNEGMRALIFFSGIAAVINIFKIVSLLIQKYKIFLPPEVRWIYENNFKNMSAQEFLNLLDLSAKQVYSPNDQIVPEDIFLDRVLLTVKGNMEIHRKSRFLTQLSPGSFIGEMSYITGGKTLASVYAASEVETLEWTREIINELKIKKPDLFIKFLESLSINLVKKIIAQNEKIDTDEIFLKEDI